MHIDSLRRRLDAIIRRRALQCLPRTWMVVREEGQAGPDELSSLIVPGDRVVVREIPREYLSPPLEKPVFYSF